MTTYVINLDRDQERLRLFLEVNGHLTDYVRFSAVDGRTMDRAALEREGIIAANLTYNNGQLGCALSHIALWRMAIAEDRIITVVEDDAILAPDFVAARDAFVRTLPAEWAIAAVWAGTSIARSGLKFPRASPKRC